MADLTATSGSGTQTSTQSPQSLVSSGSSTEASSSVQPGTATSLLTSPSGISLNPPPLSTVDLSSAGATTSTPNTAALVAIQPKHHVNTGMLGISSILFIIAIALFWIVRRSEKNTTNYY